MVPYCCVCDREQGPWIETENIYGRKVRVCLRCVDELAQKRATENTEKKS